MLMHKSLSTIAAVYCNSKSGIRGLKIVRENMTKFDEQLP